RCRYRLAACQRIIQAEQLGGVPPLPRLRLRLLPDGAIDQDAEGGATRAGAPAFAGTLMRGHRVAAQAPLPMGLRRKVPCAYEGEGHSNHRLAVNFLA